MFKYHVLSAVNVADVSHARFFSFLDIYFDIITKPC